MINGEYDWAKSFGSSGSDIGADIKISNDGSIFISGWTTGNLNNQIHAGVSNNEINNGKADIFIIKLNSEGNEIWTKIYGSKRDDLAWGSEID